MITDTAAIIKKDSSILVAQRKGDVLTKKIGKVFTPILIIQIY